MRKFLGRFAPLIDQAVISAANFALVVYSGQALSATAASQVILAMSASMILAAAVQAGYWDALFVERGSRNARQTEHFVRFALVPTAWLLTFAIGIISAGDAWFAVGLATTIAAVLLVDVVRWRNYVRHAAISTVALVIWILGAALAILVWNSWSPPTASSLLLLVGGAGVATSIATLHLSRDRETSTSGRGTWLRTRPNTVLLVDYALTTGLLSALPLMLAPLLGLVRSSGLRSAQVLLGPANVLLSSTRTLILRSGSTRLFSVTTALLGLLVVVVSVVLPHAWGEYVLGSLWEQASDLLPILGLQFFVLSMYFPLQQELRRLREEKSVLLVRVLGAVVSVVAALLVANPLGTTGVAWALVMGSVVNLVGTIIVTIRRKSRS